MDFLLILRFILYFILCAWWAFWFILFIVMSKKIKSLLNYKDYIGILGSGLQVLGILIMLITVPLLVGVMPLSTLILILIGGWILIIWVIWTIVNCIKHIEKIGDNIAIFLFTSEIFVVLLYLFFYDNLYTRLMFGLILFFFHLFWTGTMMYVLVRIKLFRPIERAPHIIVEQRTINKREEILDCPMCSNELSKSQRERYREGKTVYCTYCGQELE